LAWLTRSSRIAAPSVAAAARSASSSSSDQIRSVRQSSNPRYPHQWSPSKIGKNAVDWIPSSTRSARSMGEASLREIVISLFALNLFT
jgi:hypothetical protein